MTLPAPVRWLLSLSVCFSTLGALLYLPGSARAQPPAPDAPAYYQQHVRPILNRSCVRCHGPDEQESGLRVDTPHDMLEGGYSGPAIVAGKADDSLLIHAVTGSGAVTQMPPEGSLLTDNEVALLKRWIDAGAVAPADAAPSSDSAGPRKSSHWAYQPLVRHDVPIVARQDLVRNPIDAFIIARLQREALAASPEADRVTLIRRLSLDLLGLPPSPEQVDQFVQDRSADAYERLVDRLLSSPHYGERWARHWLDLARYADSNGYTIDGPRSIWRYRDWVIEALNSDMPFDQFTIEQIAGDLLPQPTTSQLVATGFHRNTMKNEEGGTDKEQFRVESVVDRVNTTGAVFLGLTIGCAQCHDHKYDDVTQRDYYRLFALLNSCDEPTLALPTPQQARQQTELKQKLAEARARLAPLAETAAGVQAALEAAYGPAFGATWDVALLDADLTTALAADPSRRSATQQQLVGDAFQRTMADYASATREVAALEAAQKKLTAAITTTLVMKELPQPRATHIHVRGDFLRKGQAVAPGVPAVLPQLDAAIERPTRLELARWLVDAGNPLVPRVTVNRVWQHYFGRGIVETENDFGTQGTPPTHPELLDWLAAWWVDEGWSFKALHRLIVTSHTYRQSSHERPDLASIDPDNKLLARQSRLRLDAEVIRDASLAASGLLSRKLGGPSVYPPIPDGAMSVTQSRKAWPTSTGDDRYRRGLYTYFWRSAPHPFLKLFDAPEASVTCTRRDRSSTPLQALTLLNDAASYEAAQALALRISSELSAEAADEARLVRAFRLCLARLPGRRELACLSDLIAAERSAPNASSARLVPTLSARASAAGVTLAPRELAAWTSVARALLNTDEFITRE